MAARAEGLYGLAGAVFEKELRVAARRRRYYALRFAYPLVLTAVVGTAWVSAYGLDWTMVADRASRMAESGKSVVAVVVGFQLVVIPLLAMATLSTAVNEEVRARTLGVLLASPLGRFRIVLGKFLGRLAPLGLLVACSVPVLMVVRVLGGVPWGFVLAGTCVTLTTAALVGSISMLLSSLFRRGRAVLILTPVVLVLAFYVLPALGLAAWELVASPAGMPEPGSVYALTWSPMVAIFVIYEELFRPGSLPVPWWLWSVHCGLAVGMSCLLLGVAAWRLEHLGRKLAAGGVARRARRSPRRGPMRWEVAVLERAVRRITGSVILARELVVHYGPSRWVAIAAAAAVISLAVVFDLLLIRYGRLHEGSAAVILSYTLLMATVPVVAFDAPAGIAREKERRTLTLLLATPLRRSGVVLAKAFGTICRAMPIWAVLLGHLAFFSLLGFVHPLLLLHMALLLSGPVVFFTGIGLFLGTVCRRTSTAVAVNLLLLGVLWMGAPVAVEFLGAGSEALHCVNPCFQMYVLVGGVAGATGVSPGEITYEWPRPLGSFGWAETTWFLAATTAAHWISGAAGAGAATLLLRKGRF